MTYTPQQLSFIERAKDQISNDPLTRLSPITRATIERNNFVFDAHCHVFDGECINIKYLAVRMIAGAPEAFKAFIWRLITGENLAFAKMILSKSELIENIYSNPDLIPDEDFDAFVDRMDAQIAIMETEINASSEKGLLGFSLPEFLIRCSNILRLIGSKRMSDVYVSFRDRYAIHNVINHDYHFNKELITVVLGMDLNSGWEGSIKKSNLEQIDELGQLPQAYPVLPFLPIDPRRADDTDADNLYEFFLKAFDKNNPTFFGVKCYPALGYLPSDSRLKPIFEICGEKNIPVMTHCGGETVSTFANPVIVNRNGVEESVSLSPRAARARYLNEPREWLEVLRANPGLKLCLGHFGSEGAWESENDVRAHRIPEILQMMKEFNVYSDFSFNLESGKATDHFVSKLKQQDEDGRLMRERTMFGTDFWVVLPTSNLNLDQHSFIQKTAPFKDDLLKNNVLRFLGVGALVGAGPMPVN